MDPATSHVPPARIKVEPASEATLTSSSSSSSSIVGTPSSSCVIPLDVPDGHKPAKWEAMFRQLVQFQRIHKHMRVSKHKGPHKELGNWIGWQRRSLGPVRQRQQQTTAKQQQQLSDTQRYRITRLDEIGFPWDTSSTSLSSSSSEQVAAKASTTAPSPSPPPSSPQKMTRTTAAALQHATTTTETKQHHHKTIEKEQQESPTTTMTTGFDLMLALLDRYHQAYGRTRRVECGPNGEHYLLSLWVQEQQTWINQQSTTPAAAPLSPSSTERMKKLQKRGLVVTPSTTNRATTKRSTQQHELEHGTNTKYSPSTETVTAKIRKRAIVDSPDMSLLMATRKAKKRRRVILESDDEEEEE